MTLPVASTGAGAFAWANPVVRGLSPDPSVVRVGGDYFLATSTFDHMPGIRIWQSVDLVNWTLLGGAVERPAQYRRDGRPGPIDLFAPTLRYHDGRFWLACTNVTDGQGNFLLHAPDPAGPWSDAIWLDTEAFDSSLFFDTDGICYYTRRTLDLTAPDGNLGPVVQAVLDPETGSMGPMRAITPGPRGYCSNDIEGPHVYRIGDWYYLFAAEGGTWTGHMQTVARARSPWGPFEGAPRNPVLSHRHRVMHPIQSLGHAELVDDPSGRWWALALGTRHQGRHHLLGRETFLLPVTWQGGWPILGEGGEAELSMSAETSPATGAAPRPTPGTPWAAGWTTRGQPPKGIALDGADVILPYGAALDADLGAGALYRPQSEPSQVFEATVPPPPAGAATGISAVADAVHHHSLCRLSPERGGGLRLTRQVDDLRTDHDLADPADGPLRLRIEAAPERYRFFAARPDGWDLVGQGSARLLSAESCEWFTGVRFALIAEGPSSAPARFGDVTQTTTPS